MDQGMHTDPPRDAHVALACAGAILGRALLLGLVVGSVLGVRFVPDPLGPLGAFSWQLSGQGFVAGLVALPLGLWEWAASRRRARFVDLYALIVPWAIAGQWCFLVSAGPVYWDAALGGGPGAAFDSALDWLQASYPDRLVIVAAAVASLGAATSLSSHQRLGTVLLAHAAMFVPLACVGVHEANVANVVVASLLCAGMLTLEVVALLAAGLGWVTFSLLWALFVGCGELRLVPTAARA